MSGNLLYIQVSVFMFFLIKNLTETIDRMQDKKDAINLKDSISVIFDVNMGHFFNIDNGNIL